MQRVNFAKEKSDIIAKMDGTYVNREKPKTKLEPLKKNPEKKIKLDQSNPKNVVQANKQINKVLHFFYFYSVE